MAAFHREQLLQLFEILIEKLLAAPTQELARGGGGVVRTLSLIVLY